VCVCVCVCVCVRVDGWVRACVAKCYTTVKITAGGKKNQQTGLRWQTARSLNLHNKLYSVGVTISETAMTRQGSFSGGVKT